MAKLQRAPVRTAPKAKSAAPPAPERVIDDADETAFLSALGERVRGLRARRGLTRKGLAKSSGVSERHLANLETGVGNASVVVLRQIALALDAPLAAIIGDETTASPEWLLIREMLHARSDEELRRARAALMTAFGEARTGTAQAQPIALIGLRGAGKSTLGRMLADALEVPFIELNAEIERIAGCSVAEVHNLLGPNAYRRYERRALEEALAQNQSAVIATPGGIVSDAGTFSLLLAQCTTVWLKATPAEHMQRVLDQGDMRPMHGNREAMQDLSRILDVRAAFYGKADLTFDTSGLTMAMCFKQLLRAVRALVV
jgi:XRE family transcriptional regulator, aerobic/anaerobic benzoate catabolism transcriptional regulator